MPIKIKKYTFTLPLVTIEKFLKMSPLKKNSLFRTSKQSLYLQALNQKFCTPNGKFSIVVEFNFPNGPKDQLSAYSLTGVFVLLVLFPDVEKSLKKDLALKKFFSMMNVSFRFGSKKVKEEEIILFIHQNIL